jgi:hypothetical protein
VNRGSNLWSSFVGQVSINQIEDDGADSLIDALNHNVCLTELYVKRNNIAPESTATIDYLVETRNAVLIPAAVRRASLYLIAARRATPVADSGSLAIFPKEIVKMIAMAVWMTRKDPKWIEAVSSDEHMESQKRFVEQWVRDYSDSFWLMIAIDDPQGSWMDWCGRLEQRHRINVAIDWEPKSRLFCWENPSDNEEGSVVGGGKCARCTRKVCRWREYVCRWSLLPFKQENRFFTFLPLLLERDLMTLLRNRNLVKDAEKLMGDELEGLDLTGCRICDDGAVKVAAFIPGNDTVKVVSLYNNNIGPRGAKAIAEALKYNKKLRILNLVNNQIGDVCVCDFPLFTWRMGMSFRLAPRSVVSAA